MKPKVKKPPAGRSAQSVAGEEDPGAALDTATTAASSAPLNDDHRGAPVSGAMNPGDDAPAGTPGTGEAVCHRCGGSGRVGDTLCPTCGGSGKMIRGIGGG